MVYDDEREGRPVWKRALSARMGRAHAKASLMRVRAFFRTEKF